MTTSRLIDKEYAAMVKSSEDDTIHETLRILFAEVLGLDEEQLGGLDASLDSFFDVGGYSLLAGRLVSRIRATLGIDVNIRIVFEAPTIDALAKRLGGLDLRRHPLLPASRPAQIPLSPGQARLWFLNRLDNTNAAYSIPIVLRMGGTLDRIALENALCDLVERHEILRTVYPDTLGRPYQLVKEAAEARPKLAILSSNEAALSGLVADLVGRGFDLARELPMRAHLIELGPTDQVLSIVLHHIAGDGWSLSPLGRDLSALYAARRDGRSAELSPLPVQYVDFALWQLAGLGGANASLGPMTEQIGFWKTTLADLPDEIALPHAKRRLRCATRHGAKAPVTVGAETHSGLLSLARSSRTSVFMVLQAALATLLTRLGAGTDIAIGSPIAGRTDPAVDDLIGCFVNTLVLRTDTAGNPTFNELLTRVRIGNLAAYAHQDVPFDAVVDALNPVRSADGHPLFQVMLSYQENVDADFSLEGLTITPVAADTGCAKFDLSLAIGERRMANGEAAGIEGMLEYSTDLFDAASAADIIVRFVRLLESIASAPDLPIGELDLMSTEERGTASLASITPRRETIAAFPSLFRMQASRTPDAIAVEHDGRTITYSELDSRSDQLARLLRGYGICTERVVGLCLERSAEMIVAILGILKAGGVYLPLDPSLPSERMSYLLSDTGAAVLVTQRELRSILPGTNARVVWIDEFVANPGPDDEASLPVTFEEESLAYIMYTSGSTGTPKGVAVPHGACARYLTELAELYQIRSDDTVLAVSPISFDPSIRDMFVPLLTGAKLVLIGAPAESISRHYLGAIRKNAVTVLLSVTPSLLQRICENEDRSRPEPTTVRLLMTCGEPLSHKLRAAATNTFGDQVTIYNQYGPTECTMTTTYHRAGIASPNDSEFVPIGRPLTMATVHVLDSSLNRMPVGIRGELYVGGLGVSRGYYDRPDLTAARFLPDPFSREPGARMYRTGDLVRLRADGELEFLGRRDHQVKVSGARVELGEVEAALVALDRIREAVVIAHVDQAGNSSLLAYVVADGPRSAPSAIRTALRRRLPNYMLPTSYIWVDAMPRTTNQKVDRRALPNPDLQNSCISYAPPRSPVEEAIVGIWQEALVTDRVGIDDNFFSQGGHSLLVAQVASRLSRAFGFDVPMAMLFASPTVRELVPALESLASTLVIRKSC